MAIEDYVPNIFGGVPLGYEGLLGTDQAGLDRTAALQKRANLAGLLGFGAALAQGMSPGGYRRSALQNVLTAAAQGFSGAGQTYEAGIKNAMTQQQFALQQRQMAGIQAMKLKYPDLADEFDTNPAGAFRIVAEREVALKKPVTLKSDEMLVSPTGQVIFKGETSKAQIITPDEATTLGLPQGAVYQRKPNGEITLVAGTTAKAKILTTDEANQLGLPTTGGQKYQVDANGKLDLVQGTAKDKPATSIEEYNFYLSQGGKKTYEQFLKEKTPSTTINLSDPARKAQALSENSSKYVQNKNVAESFEVATRFNNFVQAFNNPQAAGASDAVLIYSMAKMLDPGGAVQQGDIGTIAGQKSIPDKLKSIHQQFINSRTLSDAQREDLNAMAYSLMNVKRKSLEPVVKQYRNYATALQSPDPTADVQNPFDNVTLPKERVVTINQKRAKVRLGNDGNYYYTDPKGKNYIYND